MITPSTRVCGRGHHQRDVLAGARLGLVGVDHQVLRLRVVLRDEAPLHPGREARAAAAAQPGVLDHGRRPRPASMLQRRAQRLRSRRAARSWPASRPARRPSWRSAPGSAVSVMRSLSCVRRRRCVGPARAAVPTSRVSAAIRRPSSDAGPRSGPRRRGRRGIRRAPARPASRCRPGRRGWRCTSLAGPQLVDDLDGPLRGRVVEELPVDHHHRGDSRRPRCTPGAPG